MGKIQSGAGDWRNPHFVDDGVASKVAETMLGGQRLRAALAKGFALGTFAIELHCAAAITTLALAGFDFVVLDMEHSDSDFKTLEPLLLAGKAAGITLLVRPYSVTPGIIGKILDAGAHGVMIPHVDSAERAAEIVAQTRFAPRGHRGFSPLSQLDALKYPLRQLNDSTFVVLQIEGRAGLEQIHSIAAVDGVDAVFVGPYDLALSLGIPPGSPEVAASARAAVAKIPEHVEAGIYIDDPAECGKWASLGFALQCVNFDGRMLATGARAISNHARRAVGLTKA
jgi:2-keto-3-deoxy-L-rhamnonate aldolase RhmA